MINLDPSVDFCLLAVSANFFYPSLHLGATGGIISLANALPDVCCRLFRLFREGRYEEARRLQFRLVGPNKAISGAWGVARAKAAMDLMGCRGDEPRHPLNSLREQVKENIRARIAREGFLPEDSEVPG